MKRFVEGTDRSQSVLFPEHLDDYVSEDNIVRIVAAFIEALDLKALGFAGAEPARTGRPSYHPAVLLGIYIYGYPDAHRGALARPSCLQDSACCV